MAWELIHWRGKMADGWGIRQKHKEGHNSNSIIQQNKHTHPVSVLNISRTIKKCIGCLNKTGLFSRSDIWVLTSQSWQGVFHDFLSPTNQVLLSQFIIHTHPKQLNKDHWINQKLPAYLDGNASLLNYGLTFSKLHVIQACTIVSLHHDRIFSFPGKL
jgi:hypothetical protein